MSGFAENLAVQLVADILIKSLRLGYHIIENSNLYIHDAEKFSLRLRMQIGIMEAIGTKLRDIEIRQRFRPADCLTYFDVMAQLHSLLRKYVKRRCQPCVEKEQLLLAASAEDLFKVLEDNDVLRRLSESERTQSWRTWLRVKNEASWAVWRKEKNEKLIQEIEFWGGQLDKFASWTIPGMFPGATYTARDVRDHVGDSRLVTTNIKSEIMIARRMGSMASDMSGLTLVEESTTVDYTQIKLLDKGYVGPKGFGGNVDDEARSELGGIDRRQWADFKDTDGTTSRVIVEFKARPTPEDAIYSMKSVTNEANALIRTLRVAAQKSDTFRVLYCHGWYETHDHFGLVYRLPPFNVPTQCESLGNILLCQDYKTDLARDLENRIKLAKALAWTMFELHSVDWLHKSFHPDNILLFGQQVPGGVHFDWSAPYVVGFDSSRSNSGVSGKLDFKAQWTSRVYTHPDRQLQEYARYQKIHDIYSLGVVLLEMGRLECFSASRRDEQWNRASPHKLRDIFVQKAKQLKPVLGSTFREVVLTCLNGDFANSEAGDEYLLLGDFRSQVCEKLDQIKF